MPRRPTLQGGELEPDRRVRRVRLHAGADQMEQPEHVLRLGIPLVGGLAIPAVGRLEILRRMNPHQILRPQQQLRGNDSLLADVDQSRLRTATGSLNDVNE